MTIRLFHSPASPYVRKVMVTAIERGWPLDAKGAAALAENTQGWTQFLFGLKAWLESGVNIRLGAYGG